MYSIALWISLFFRFGLFDSYCQRRAADYKFFVLIVRCMCITVILFLGIVIKTLVLPNGTLLITHSGALFVSRSSTPVISEDRIYRNCNEMDLVRLTGYQKHELVYRNFHIMLKYDGKTLLKFNKMAERGKLHKIEVKSADHMYRYEFDALIYSKDDVPFVIKFKDINKYNMRDEALIEACEKLISEGYFEAFEFACEYLLAYDEDFIKPVIEIYSQKEPDYFDEDFISRRNSYIKPEYMKEFARSIR